jgi:hypothetical protein
MQQPEWPNNGIEFNRWYTGLGRFIRVLQAFYWGKAPQFKYVNIRIDTRNGNFLVLTDEKERVDPMEIAKHVDMSKVDDAIARFQRTGVELFRQAQSLGWKDDGEGALEFMLRRTREVAFEDCGMETK